VSVAIRKLEGVESVEVSLNEGMADVSLEPGNRLDPERIRRAVRDNGFTPKGAEVRVAGRLVEKGGSLALQVSALDAVYLLTEHPDSKGLLAELRRAAGAEVIVSGHWPEGPAASPSTPQTLQLREFSLPAPR
jgi:copper chaperone CopZ